MVRRGGRRPRCAPLALAAAGPLAACGALLALCAPAARLAAVLFGAQRSPSPPPRLRPQLHATEVEVPAGYVRQAPGTIEVIQDDCTDGTCGKWAVRSLSQDIKETEALGIEVRTDCVQVGTFSFTDGLLKQGPITVPLPPEAASSGAKAFEAALVEAVRAATAPLAWNGVVGFSISRSVAKALEMPDVSFLYLVRTLGPIVKSAGLEPTFMHPMVHTEAAGYAQLAANAPATAALEVDTREDEDAPWRQLVLVATIGENLGAVLFKDGHRVKRSGLNTMITARWMQESLDQQDQAIADAWRRIGWPKPRVPEVGSEAWPDYVRLADQYVLDLVQFASPDRVVLVPTGAPANWPGFLDNLLPHLHRTQELGAKQGFGLSGSLAPQEDIVKGAAMAALVELRSVRARVVVKQALQGAASLAVLSRPQLRAVFDAFDADGSGHLTRSELSRALELMGLSRDVDEVFSGADEESFTFDVFRSWWRRYVVGAKVLAVTNGEDLQDLVSKPPKEVPGGYGPLLVFEVTFSFCRACKGFTKLYEQFADEYPDVRFVTMMGNYNRASMAVVGTLNVTKAPAFYAFRRGTNIHEPVLSWVGTSKEKFEKNLAEAKRLVAEALAES